MKAKFAQPLCRLPVQLGDAFYAVDPPHELRQDRGLVTGAGTYFKNIPGRLRLKQGLCHEGHDIRLGDGLVVTDRQGIIAVGMARNSIADETVPRSLQHRLQYGFVLNSLLAQPINQTFLMPRGGHAGPFVLGWTHRETFCSHSDRVLKSRCRVKSTCIGVTEIKPSRTA